MKYMLMLVRSDEEWEGLSDGERDYDAIMRWWMGLAEKGVLRDGAELQPARTATTIKWDDRSAVTMDGPFMEAKETIGGYGVVEVDDLDAAIAIAKSWPGRGHKVEIRPIVPR
jgi:hypothetical protein